MSEVRRTAVVADPDGLHVRLSARFARTAAQFHSRVAVLFRDQRVSAESLLNLLELGAGCGDELVIVAHGKDAESAADALSAVIADADPPR